MKHTGDNTKAEYTEDEYTNLTDILKRDYINSSKKIMLNPVLLTASPLYFRPSH